MNILGRPFSAVVTNQINARQDSLGENKISSSDLLYQQTKTPWLRLASSVDVKNEGTILKKALGLGFSESDLLGSGLAKNFMLQGGAISTTTEGSGGNFKMDFKTNSGLDFGANFNGAYGWGGTTDRGLVPMPGVTGATVKYINNGALTKTEINIKCFSRAQLALIDILYMRPGYTVLLEFGWSVYLDSNEPNSPLTTFETFSSPALRYLFNKPKDQYGLIAKIKEEKDRTCGNYEAVYGKISNFNWKFNPDGSYDCTITLVGMGELIESLKINGINLENESPSGTSESAKENNDDIDELPLVSQAEKSSLNKWLYAIYEESGTWFGSDYDGNFFDKKIKDFCLINEDGSTTPTTTINIKNAEFHCEIKSSDRGDDNDEQVQIYITLGYLLAWIQKNIFLKNTKVPICAFDFDFENLHTDQNLFTFPRGNFSSNPLCCIVPFEQPVIDKDELNKSLAVGDFTGLSFQKFKQRLKNIVGYGVDIKFGGYNDKIFGTVNKKHMKYGGTATNPGGFKWDDNCARLSQILININEIASVLESIPEDMDNAKSLNKFLKKLIGNVNKSLGGVNDIAVELSDDQSKIVFRNKTPMNYIKKPPTSTVGKLCTFNTFGKGSAIKNISIEASIPSNFSTMVTIGSQANGSQAAGNATSFSNYNKGLVDRVMPTKTNIGDGTGEDDDDEVKEVALVVRVASLINIMNSSSGFSDYIFGGAGGVWDQVMDDRLWFSKDIDAFNSIHSQYIQALMGYYCQPDPEGKSFSAPPFFLPFNFSLDVDGISGIRLFEKFKIDNKVLPLTYDEDDVDILVKSIDHEVNLSSWTTKIGTQSAPSFKPKN